MYIYIYVYKYIYIYTHIIWPKSHSSSSFSLWLRQFLGDTLWCHQSHVWLIKNPRTEWRFLARKITYSYGPFSIAMFDSWGVTMNNMSGKHYMMNIINQMCIETYTWYTHDQFKNWIITQAMERVFEHQMRPSFRHACRSPSSKHVHLQRQEWKRISRLWDTCGCLRQTSDANPKHFWLTK